MGSAVTTVASGAGVGAGIGIGSGLGGGVGIATLAPTVAGRFMLRCAPHVLFLSAFAGFTNFFGMMFSCSDGGAKIFAPLVFGHFLQ